MLKIDKKKIAIILAVAVSVCTFTPSFAYPEESTGQTVTENLQATESEASGSLASKSLATEQNVAEASIQNAIVDNETTLVINEATESESENEEFAAYCGYDDFGIEIDVDRPKSKSFRLFSLESGMESYYKTPVLPDIRNQVGGICWAFTTVGGLEISMMKEGLANQSERYSEYALAYFGYNGQADPLGTNTGDDGRVDNTQHPGGDGGNMYVGAMIMSGWVGASAYSDFTEDDFEHISERDKSDVCYKDKAVLTDAYFIPCEQSDRTAIKEAIKQYGAVQIGCHIYNSSYPYVYNQNGTGNHKADHAVLVVGWDDSIPAASFSSANNNNLTPDGNGAWIIKNSWGSGWGDSGYYYLSYYDQSILSTAVCSIATPSTAYDNNYHYDGTGNPSGYVELGKYDRLANIFTISTAGNAGQKQELKAVSVAIDDVQAPLKIDIYALNNGYVLPTDGTLIYSTDVESYYNGIYTFDITGEKIILPEGTVVSVVVSPRIQSGSVSIYADMSLQSGSYKFVDYKKSGVCYAYDGTLMTWSDCSTDGEFTPRIKLFTSNTTDTISHTYGYVYDTGSHWKKCIHCESTVSNTLEAHKGGTADCKHKAICSVCGAEYGSYGEHNYGSLIAKVDSTYSSTGLKEHYYCNECDKYFDSNKNEVLYSSLVIAKKQNPIDGGGSTKGGGSGGGGGSSKKTTTGGTFSQYWKEGANGIWYVYDKMGNLIRTAWLCDSAVTANGVNVWYLLNTDGSMMSAGLVQDGTGNFYSLETDHNGYFGMLRYKNGYYNCNGQQVYLEFEQSHNGSFAAVKNADGLARLKAIYGVTQYGVNNSNCVYTGNF